MNTLRQSLEEYLILRRRLGFKLRDPGQQLPHFVRFMERRRATYITQALALEWAQRCSSTNPAHWAQRLRFVRGFARHRSATDPRTQIPVEGLLPHRFKRAKPYPYTEAEIRDLMRAALTLPPRGSLRPWTYYNLIGLLSVSGLRFGEARNLELRDVDLQERILSIRNGKFGKSRLVPLHPSTCERLADYLVRRERFLAGRSCAYFFTSLVGTRLPEAATHKTFRALTRSIGLGISGDGHWPRMHDFRHRFATQTLLRWYRSGEDPERSLPILSAYLGHAHPSDTYWYLSNNPELMREAMNRLENRWEGRS